MSGSTPNRTKLELKHSAYNQKINPPTTPNRTKLELKLAKTGLNFI